MMDHDPKSKKLEEQLEQRVRRLEDQMTILKNQIQNSLLEIQEVLATRFYHPTLRPTDEGDDEEVSPPPSRWGGHESSSQSSKQANMPGAQMPQASSGQPDLVAPPPPAPKVKKVSLDDIRRSRQEVATAAANSGNTVRDGGFDLVAFAEMVNWVNTSIARVGNAYTREAIDDCLTDGSIAPQVAEQLRQLIGDEPPGATRDDVEPDEVVAVTTELRAILSRNAH